MECGDLFDHILAGKPKQFDATNVVFSKQQSVAAVLADVQVNDGPLGGLSAQLSARWRQGEASETFQCPDFVEGPFQVSGEAPPFLALYSRRNGADRLPRIASLVELIA
jgi:hypothetical protein